jgi:hypothetical protein
MDNEFVPIEKNIYLIDLNNFDLDILSDEFLININKLMKVYDHDDRLNTQLQLKEKNRLFFLK